MIKRLIPKTFRIQYASSMYVDTFDKVSSIHFVKPVAPVLVFNGNIGKAKNRQTYDFLSHCSRIWKDIIYIPGSYEVDGPNCMDEIRYMKKKFGTLPRVHVLCDDILYLPYANTVFLGTMNNKQWLYRKFLEQNSVRESTKIVALTTFIPDISMVHPVDSIYNFSRNYDLYPAVDAWICGYTRGGLTRKYANGVVCAYNALGPMNSKNDFNMNLGWSRSAYLEITTMNHS